MRITKVTTRLGDDGETSLGGGQRVFKDDLRIEAGGTVDELQSAIGLALAEGPVPRVAAGLQRIQNELFIVGSDLCVLEDEKRGRQVPVIEDRHLAQLEGEIGEFLATLPPLREFVLPGGPRASALLHVARTVCRRAERRVVALSRTSEVNSRVLKYLNRLSDWLFLAARIERREGDGAEPQWEREG